MSSRSRLLKAIANRIVALDLSHPTRVGIDGITASGKSTFARELTTGLVLRGRHCVLTTLDGFHNPKRIRYQRGRESAEGYYHDAYNCDGIVENLLRPLGTDGDFHYREKIFDLQGDAPVDLPFSTLASGQILIVDGSFALRRELHDHWDFKIYLNVDFAIAEARAGTRDAQHFGSAARAREVTRLRYHGAHRLHQVQAAPETVADVVVDNHDPERAIGRFKV